MRRKKKKLLMIGKGDKKYGFGHIMRLSNLYRSFDKKFSINMLINKDETAIDILRARNIKPTTYRNNSDLSERLESQNKFDMILIDMLEVPKYLLIKAEKKSNTLFVFDDLNHLSPDHFAGISFQPQEPVRERKNRMNGLLQLKGANYFPVASEYKEYRRKKRFKKSVKNIIISLGAGDYMGRIQGLIERLDQGLNRDIVLHVVLGSSHLREKPRYSPRVIVHSHLSSLAGLIKEADLGIIAAGFTKFEFMCIGTPFILVSLNDHQQLLAKKYARKGYGIYAESVGKILKKPDLLLRTVNNLINAPEKRKKIFNRSRQLVDGKGNERIEKLMTNV